MAVEGFFMFVAKHLCNLRTNYFKILRKAYYRYFEASENDQSPLIENQKASRIKKRI